MYSISPNIRLILSTRLNAKTVERKNWHGDNLKVIALYLSPAIPTLPHSCACVGGGGEGGGVLTVVINDYCLDQDQVPPSRLTQTSGHPLDS